jgi:hypothetical protein
MVTRAMVRCATAVAALVIALTLTEGVASAATVATAPYRRWEVVEGRPAPAAGSRVVLPACPGRNVENACPWMQQNFKLRAVDGADHSAPRLVKVDPLVDLAVTRERNGASPWVDAAFQASVGLPPVRRGCGRRALP